MDAEFILFCFVMMAVIGFFIFAMATGLCMASPGCVLPW